MSSLKPTILSQFFAKRWPLVLAMIASFSLAIFLSLGTVMVSVVGFSRMIQFTHHVLQGGGLLAEENKLRGSADEFVFQDIDFKSKYYEALKFLKHQGVVQGYADGNVRIDESLTRAEFLKIVVSAKKIFPSGISNAFCFKDVQSDWFAPYVCFGKNQGWVSDAEYFYPALPIAQAESIKILTQAFDLRKNLLKQTGYDRMDDGEWYKEYYQIAEQNGVMGEQKDFIFQAEKPLTRGEAFLYLYRVMK